MNLDNLRYTDEFEEILSEADVDKSEVCLTGSAPLAVYGIRENGDLDFVATPEAREKIEALARRRPDYGVDDDGHMSLGGNVDLSRPDRYDVIDFDDSELIHNDDLHITLEGYKVIRLEVALGFKGALRRPKDVDDIQLITNSRYVGNDDWNWEHVRLVPIWERPSDTNGSGVVSLFKQGTDLLREEGVSTTFLEGIQFMKRQIPRESVSRVKHTMETTFSRETSRPLPAILNDQLTPRGTFERNDLVFQILAQEGNEFAMPEQLPTDPGPERVHLTESGKIRAGIQQLADLIVEWDDRLPKDATLLDVPIKHTRKEPLEPRTDEWVTEEFDEPDLTVITQRREQLLKDSGTAFYVFLWPAVQEYFDEVEALVRERVSVIDTTDYRLDGNLAEVVKDIYNVDKRNEDWVRDKKIYELQKYDPCIRVLSLRLPDPEFDLKSAEQLSQRTYELKMELRKEIQQIHPDYTYSTCLHITDNYTHNAHISDLLWRLDANRQDVERTAPDVSERTDQYV